MGTYKVPQNVEAEDKILGPLSLKQFIYALIGLGWGFLTFAILKSVLLLSTATCPCGIHPHTRTFRPD